MKAYIASTGIIFGLMTVMHVWRAMAEWPHPAQTWIIIGLIALIAIPATLAWWACWCLRNSGADRNKKVSVQDDSTV